MGFYRTGVVGLYNLLKRREIALPTVSARNSSECRERRERRFAIRRCIFWHNGAGTERSLSRTSLCVAGRNEAIERNEC